MEKTVDRNRLSRLQAIERIRESLTVLTDDEHCACAVAGRLNVFCGGFAALRREVSDALLVDLEQAAPGFPVGARRSRITLTTSAARKLVRPLSAATSKRGITAPATDGTGSTIRRSRGSCFELTGASIHIG